MTAMGHAMQVPGPEFADDPCGVIVKAREVGLPVERLRGRDGQPAAAQQQCDHLAHIRNPVPSAGAILSEFRRATVPLPLVGCPRIRWF
jgi:hypothetical protein